MSANRAVGWCFARHVCSLLASLLAGFQWKLPNVASKSSQVFFYSLLYTPSIFLAGRWKQCGVVMYSLPA